MIAGLMSIALLVFAACSKSDNHRAKESPANQSAQPTGNPAQPVTGIAASQALPAHGSGYAHVKFRPSVRMMEAEDGKRALIGVSSNDAGLLFDASNATARSLRAGDVLVIKGLLARNVLAAEATPDCIVVITQQASLVDVVQDGGNLHQARGSRSPEPRR